MAFLRRKAIRLKAYTAHASMAEFHPIAPAKKFLPKWWKNLGPSTVSWRDALRLEQFNNVKTLPQSTMKGCYGLRELYNHGVIIPSPSDIGMAVDDGKITITALPHLVKVNQHNPLQWEGWLPENWENLKIMFPWRLRCEERINWIGMRPSFADNDYSEHFFVPPGIVDLRYSPETNVNLMVNNQSGPKEFFIPAGDPFWHLIPLTDRKVELTVEVVKQEDLQLLAPTYIQFGKFVCGHMQIDKRKK